MRTKVSYHIIFLEICQFYKILPKSSYAKKHFRAGNPSTKFVITDARKSSIICYDYTI